MSVSGLYEKHPTNSLRGREVTHLFMEYGKLITFSKGTALYSPGEVSDKVFCINHGEIKIYRSTNDGKEIILELLGPDSVFGEVELINNFSRRNTAIAKMDTILHYVTQATLKKRIEHDPRVASWIINKISQKQIRTENLLENLLFKSAEAKVANVLLELAQIHGVRDKDGLLVDYLITHQEIGNTIATTRETVSYVFMKFRKIGIIATPKRKTVILDQTALEKIAAE